MKLNISKAHMSKHLPAFMDYLRAHGCEIQEPSNEFELVRFKSALGIGVLYTGKKGISCNVPFVADAVTLFFNKTPWQSGKVQPTKRSPPKQIITKTVFYKDQDSSDFPPENLLEFFTWLTDLIVKIPPENQKSATIIFDHGGYEDGPINIDIGYKRLETDEELLLREQEEEKMRQSTLARKLEYYKRLKAELGE